MGVAASVLPAPRGLRDPQRSRRSGKAVSCDPVHEVYWRAVSRRTGGWFSKVSAIITFVLLPREPQSEGKPLAGRRDLSVKP